MPAIAALTINDGATTPVAHTFSPVTTNGSKAVFADRSSTTLKGNRVITDEVRTPANGTGAYRRITGFSFPTEAVVDGSTVVARLGSAQVVFNFAQDSTEQERKDQLAYVANWLANASVKTAIPNNEAFY